MISLRVAIFSVTVTVRGEMQLAVNMHKEAKERQKGIG